jgi:hypothetical protein
MSLSHFPEIHSSTPLRYLPGPHPLLSTRPPPAIYQAPPAIYQAPPAIYQAPLLSTRVHLNRCQNSVMYEPFASK